MITEELLQQIKDMIDISVPLGYSVHNSFCALVEETGEVATTLNVNDGWKKRVLKEDTKDECIDVVFTALELFYMTGGTDEFLKEYLQHKINKRKKKLDALINP